MAVIAVVPAAGSGTRLGLGPKAFVRLGGQALLDHAIAGLAASGVVDRIVVALPVGVEWTATNITVPVSTVSGGGERTDSVRAALEPVHIEDDDIVLVHDAARALTPPTLISAVLEAIRADDEVFGVIPVLPIADTVIALGPDGPTTVDRAELRTVQTPQGFRAGALRAGYAGASVATDDATLVRAAGYAVHTIPGDPAAFKITIPADLEYAEFLLARADNLAAGGSR